MKQEEIQARLDDGRELCEHGCSSGTVIQHLMTKYGISRAQAYRDLADINTAIAQDDDGRSAEEIEAAGNGAELGPMLARQIQQALSRGDVRTVKALMPCLEMANRWRGVGGVHSRYKGG